MHTGQLNTINSVKHFGEWSSVDEKLRITYKNSEESVLFEDTSSISYLKVSTPNPLFAILGFFSGFVIMFTVFIVGEDVGFGTGFLSFLVPFIIGLIITFSNKIEYDNVAIETRGGKLIQFSVSKNRGKEIMEQIEKEKRDWQLSRNA